MATIRANCRERFSANDLEFVASSLGSNDNTLKLAELLTDPEALNAALESDRLLKSILELPGNVPVSPQFYFYVLTRHMLMRFDRDVADYVASVLAGFVGVERASRPFIHSTKRARRPFHYWRLALPRNGAVPLEPCGNFGDDLHQRIGFIETVVRVRPRLEVPQNVP